MKTKVISFILSICLLFSVCTMFADAATVYLTTNQRIASSADVSAKQIYFSGNNNYQSAYSVYFIVKHMWGGVYYTDMSKTVEIGKGFTNTNSNTRSLRNWKLTLNPDGANHYGCIATGNINKKQ